VPTSTSALNGSNGFKINGITHLTAQASQQFRAMSMAMALMTSHWAGAAPTVKIAGRAMLCLAGGFSANLNLSALNGSNGFKINGINERDFRQLRSVQQDVNGDGFDDIIIGAPFASQRSILRVIGVARCRRMPTSTSLSTAAALKINGIDAYDRSGIQSVQQAMSMAMALMTSSLGFSADPNE